MAPMNDRVHEAEVPFQYTFNNVYSNDPTNVKYTVLPSTATEHVDTKPRLTYMEPGNLSISQDRLIWSQADLSISRDRLI